MSFDFWFVLFDFRFSIFDFQYQISNFDIKLWISSLNFKFLQLIFYLCLAGNKERKARRLARWECYSSAPERLRQQILNYLHPTATHPDSSKPPIPDLYSNEFNIVDRFNKIRSMIKFKPRIGSEDMRLLIGLIENAIVETWVLFKDWKGDTLTELNKHTIRHFAVDLGRELQKY